MKHFILAPFLAILSFSVWAQDMYDANSITTIKLYFSQPDWNSQLVDFYLDDLDQRLLADSVVINGSVKDSVGVKYKGNSTFDENNVKNPINIALDYIQGNQDYQGFRTIKLSNVKNDPSFLREVLSYEIARKYMVASQSNYAKVYVNDNYLGLYVSSESINSDFQSDYLYSDNDNTRFKCNPESVFEGNGSSLEYLGNDSSAYYDFYEIKTDYSWQDLIDFTYTIENSPENIESILNVDRAIWMLAFNNLLVNLDSYSGPFRQNYYLIKDDFNIINPIVWDLNESFGGFAMLNEGGGGGPPGQTNLSEVDLFLRESEDGWPLLNLILNDPTYRRMYVAHLKTMLSENFSNDLYATRALELQNLIASDVQSDPNGFYTYEEFISNLNNTIAGGGPGGGDIGITELMNARVTYLQQQAEMNDNAPTIGTIATQPSVINTYSNPTINVNVSDADNVIFAYRFRPNEHFTKLEMLDDGLNNDGAAGDGTYGISINVDALDIQYYIYAENQDAGIFSPQRAEHEFHSMAVVGSLVINELMASNTSSVADVSSGIDEYDDWVELYNGSNQSINLDGYYLSDKESTLDKWQFPNVSIDADDYLIVWLDGDELIQDGLHTSFKLSAQEEALFLSTSNLFIVDAIYYQDIPSDMGYARFENGSGPFRVQNHTFDDNNGQQPVAIQQWTNSVKVFPNPAKNFITIEANAKNIEVTDVLGKKYLNLSNVRNSARVNTSTWPCGLYIINVDGYTEKIIIQ
jgi:hypothetical protein